MSIIAPNPLVAHKNFTEILENNFGQNPRITEKNLVDSVQNGKNFREVFV